MIVQPNSLLNVKKFTSENGHRNSWLTHGKYGDVLSLYKRLPEGNGWTMVEPPGMLVWCEIVKRSLGTRLHGVKWWNDLKSRMTSSVLMGWHHRNEHGESFGKAWFWIDHLEDGGFTSLGHGDQIGTTSTRAETEIEQCQKHIVKSLWMVKLLAFLAC